MKQVEKQMPISDEHWIRLRHYLEAKFPEVLDKKEAGKNNNP